MLYIILIHISPFFFFQLLLSRSVVSDSVRPHRRQPTRLPHPWDSPGKNTGVGCHFLLRCLKVKSAREVAQSCPTLSDPMDCSPPDFSIHGIFQARVLEWGAIAFSARNCLHDNNSIYKCLKCYHIFSYLFLDTVIWTYYISLLESTMCKSKA